MGSTGGLDVVMLGGTLVCGMERALEVWTETLRGFSCVHVWLWSLQVPQAPLGKKRSGYVRCALSSL